MLSENRKTTINTTVGNICHNRPCECLCRENPPSMHPGSVLPVQSIKKPRLASTLNPPISSPDPNRPSSLLHKRSTSSAYPVTHTQHRTRLFRIPFPRYFFQVRPSSPSSSQILVRSLYQLQPSDERCYRLLAPPVPRPGNQVWSPKRIY